MTRATRYIGFWWEILRATWRQAPVLTVLNFVLETCALGAGIGMALALRAAAEGAAQHATGEAVTGAVGAALAGTATLVVTRLRDLVGSFLIVEKLGPGWLESRINAEIAGLEGIEHLERNEFLDRIGLLRNSSWDLVAGLWTAVRTVFAMIQLAAVMLLLGSVSPWLLALFALAGFPLWCDGRARKALNRAQSATAEQFRLQRGLFELATDVAAGKEIRTSGAVPALVEHQNRAWQAAVSGRMRARLRACWWRTLGWGIFTAGFLGALAVVVRHPARDSATLGDVVMAVTLAASMQQTVQSAVGQLVKTMSSGLVVEPYLWLREYAEEDRRRVTGVASPPEALRRGIELRGLGHTYPGTGQPALVDVTVSLPAGSVVAVVGEYGSGKTTLVKLLQKFYRPTQGCVTVDGMDLAELDTAQWRARSSAAYQDFGRYPHVTFAEAVGMGDLRLADDPAAVAQAVADADADRIVERLPDGYATTLGVAFGGIDLSEGQWQKTALARASMRRTPLLFVMDEPTASLDAPSEHAIFERYMERARLLAATTGAITVIVSHRFSTVAGADLVLVLDHGRLVEHGTHHELLAADGKYAELYGIQAHAYARTPAR